MFKVIYGKKYLRPNEDEYWKEVVFAAAGAQEFKMVEFLLDNANYLLKDMPEHRQKIVENMKFIANFAADNKKFFICSKIVGILLVWLPQLDKEEDGFAISLIKCLEKIGVFVIKLHEQRLFSEMCNLVAKNLQAINEQQEEYWDSLAVNWGSFALQEGLVIEFSYWQKLLVKLIILFYVI